MATQGVGSGVQRSLGLFRVLVVLLGLAASGPDPGSCPGRRCRCLDGGSIIACQGSGLVRVPGVLQQTLIIDLDQNRIAVLPNASFRSGVRLEMVSLQENGLVRLEPDAFAEIRELRILRLGRNRLTSVPDRLFRNNGRLLVLDLHRNRLAVLPDGAVRHLHSLQLINVSANRLTTVAMGTGFRHATQLSNVDLSGNDIVAIETGSFAVASSWDPRIDRHVNLSGCHLRHIDPGVFRAIPQVRTLSLERNPLLPQRVLGEAIRNVADTVRILILSHLNVTDVSDLLRHIRLDVLAELDLSNNRIRSVAEGTFRYAAENLRKLDLSGNRMTELGGGLLELSRLEKLDASRNELARIDPGLFGGLHFLKDLDLSRNSLAELGSDLALPKRISLRSLDFSHNRIETLSFRHSLVSIETVRATHNRISNVQFLRGLQQLRRVDISHNAIWRMDEELFALASGTELSVNVSHNALRLVANTAFRFCSYEFLDLSGNRLRDLDYYGWDSVQTIYAADNQIKFVTAAFFRGSSLLQNLYLQGNLLTHLPNGAFDRMLRLRILDLSRNPIGAFLHERSRLEIPFPRRLEVLRLRKTGLESIGSGLVRNLTSLRDLDCGENRIARIDENSFAGTSKLRHLNLASNRLRDLAPSLVDEIIRALRSVDLSDNRLDCSCRLALALHRLLSAAANLLNRTSYRCHSPDTWRDRPVEDFYAESSSRCLADEHLRTFPRFLAAIAAAAAVVVASISILIRRRCLALRQTFNRRAKFHRTAKYECVDEDYSDACGRGGGGGGEREEGREEEEEEEMTRERTAERRREHVARLKDETTIPILLAS